MTNFWQAAKQHKKVNVTTEREYRLYYNDAGQPIDYTTDKRDGKYIVIDQQTWAESRPDVLIKNEKLIRINQITEYRKLVPSTEGTETLEDDITIIGSGQQWKTKYYDAD